MAYLASAIAVETTHVDPITGEEKVTEKIIEEFPAAPITILVLEGGAIRGIAYAGLIKMLHIAGVLEGLKHVAGSSIGAISAMLIATGFTGEEIEDHLKLISVMEFLECEKPWYITPKIITKVKQGYNIIVNENHSLSSGKKLLSWIEDMIEKKLGKRDATFADLAALAELNPVYKKLYVTGSNMTKSRIEVFSHLKTPNMPIALAVRISGAYPGVFEGVELGGDLYMDAGIMNNLPYFIFNDKDNKDFFAEGFSFNKKGANPSILNIKIDTDEEMDSLLWNKPIKKKIKSFQEYSQALVDGALSRNTEINEQFPTNTVQIYDHKIKPFEEISSTQIKKLIDAGCESIWGWLETHVSEARKIKTWTSVADWLAKKKIEEIAQIRNIYQAKLLHIQAHYQCKNKQEIQALEEKVEELARYIQFRSTNLITTEPQQEFIFSRHINIKPVKPRANMDEQIKLHLKNMLAVNTSRRRLLAAKIHENSTKLAEHRFNRLHDGVIFDVVVYLTGLVEKNKILEVEYDSILNKMPEVGGKTANKVLCSKAVAFFHGKIQKYLSKKTLFSSTHHKLATRIDKELAERTLSYSTKEEINIKLDLVVRDDLKVYLLALMLYLKWIKCNDHLFKKVTQGFEILFDTKSVPEDFDSLATILKVEKPTLLIMAYRIEGLINYFKQIEKTKKDNTQYITLDLLLNTIANHQITFFKPKSKRIIEEDMGIELNFIYDSFALHEKFSIFQRLSQVKTILEEGVQKQIKENHNVAFIEKLPKALRRI